MRTLRSTLTLEQEMAAFASVMATSYFSSNVWNTYKQNVDLSGIFMLVYLLRKALKSGFSRFFQGIFAATIAEHKSVWTTKPLGIADIPRLSEIDQQCLQLINEFLVSYECDATSEALFNDCEKLGFAFPNTIERKERIKKENIIKILEHLTANNLVDFFEKKEIVHVHLYDDLRQIGTGVCGTVRANRKELPSAMKTDKSKKGDLAKVWLHKEKQMLSSTWELWEMLGYLKLQLIPIVSPTHHDHLSKNQDDNSNSPVCSNKDKHLISETGGSSLLDSGSASINGMDVLKNFLDTKGTEFSTEPEFLPFYALPFISDPTSHPSFKNIFTESSAHETEKENHSKVGRKITSWRFHQVAVTDTEIVTLRLYLATLQYDLKASLGRVEHGEGWANSLRVSVEQFVVDHCWGEGVSPRLVALCSTSQRVPPSQRRLHCTEVHRSYHELKRRFHRLNKDHHNLIVHQTEIRTSISPSSAVELNTTSALANYATEAGLKLFNVTRLTIADVSDSARPRGSSTPPGRKYDVPALEGIATELTSALENSVQGQAVDLKTTLNNCTRIFPELFKQAQARPEMSEETLSLLTGIDHSPVTNLCMSYDLDFRKLKHHLATASIKTRLLLLQALRWVSCVDSLLYTALC
uniref:ARMC9 CTLH-like domain-containing protein n=1 Tax=Timema cristinae TaxID=61476 RepID=A0A7R9H050_TIMCR|nr:unnamed protein product [Timema cristinae]